MTINNDQASFYFTKEKHHRKSRQTKILTTRALFVIVQFTVACLVAKPLIRSEAKVDLVMIQTLLLFKCKLPCCYANQVLVYTTTRSPSASLQIKSLATKYTTVKWPIYTRVTTLFSC